MRPYIMPFAAFMLLLISCCKDDNSCDDPTPEDSDANTAMVDGVAFKPTETDAFETLTGIEIKMIDDVKEINIRLKDDLAGTYTIENSSPEGRTKSMEGRAEYIDGNGEIFYGESGTVDVTRESESTVTATFSLSLKSVSGKKASITAGSVSKLSVQKMPAGCLLTKWSDSEQSNRLVMEYDGQGKLIDLKFDDTGQIIYRDHYIFTYVNGQVSNIRTVFHHGDEVGYRDYNVEYMNGLVSSVSDNDRTYIFAYTDGKLTGVHHERDGDTEAVSLAYDEQANLTSFFEETGQEAFLTYDGAKNPGTLLIKALGDQPALLYFVDGSLELMSENNPLEGTSNYFEEEDADAYDYEYNTQGYPIQITHRRNGDLIDQAALTYSNCN